jgi:hypothetical protein
MVLAEAPANMGNAVGIAVDAGKVVHTMAGGIGASWHAIADDPRCELAGSAWGGNPPPENAAQWKQLTDYAEWLGLDWMRVEVEQRMYEPERNVFTWDSPEMRTLYHILDWCQQKRVDVFFQQQYSRVAWNSYPEYRNDPLHSKVLACTVDGGKLDAYQRVFAAALQSPRGNLTLMVLNDAGEPWEGKISWRGVPPGKTLYRYRVSSKERDRPNLKIEPEKEFLTGDRGGIMRDALQPMSITVYSSYHLLDSDKGVINDQ